MAALEVMLTPALRSDAISALARGETLPMAPAAVSRLGLGRRTASLRCLVWMPGERRQGAQCAAVRAVVRAERVVEKQGAKQEGARLLRPLPAEGARTVMETCVEGTLSTLSEDGWPLGTEVRFAVDMQGNPVLCLHPGATHTLHLLRDSRCSLHVQVMRGVCESGVPLVFPIKSLEVMVKNFAVNSISFLVMVVFYL